MKAPQRVLVVDDSLDNVRSLALLLQTMGHHVDYAINGTAALAMADQFKPDIVFLDILLPDDHGAGVCTELRKSPQLAKTRIIGITGSDRMLDLQLALDAGCDDVLRKPVPPQVFERLLEGGASRRKIRELMYQDETDATGATASGQSSQNGDPRLAETSRLMREMERLKARARMLLHEHRYTVAALKEVQDKLDATQPFEPIEPSAVEKPAAKNP